MAKIPVTWGTDPEVSIYLNGRLERASNYFNSLTSKIGKDGAGGPLEFRPSPSENYDDVIQELRKLLKRVVKRGFFMDVKGDDQALGCHIHLGGEFARTHAREIALAMDEWLGAPFRILNGRARSSYNILYKESSRGVEMKSYGGFEYRCLPAAVMYHPETLRFVYRVSEWIVNNLSEASRYQFLSLEEWQRNVAQRLKTTEAIVETIVACAAGTDEFGCRIGSKASRAMKLLSEGSLTLAEVQAQLSGNFSGSLKRALDKGFLVRSGRNHYTRGTSSVSGSSSSEDSGTCPKAISELFKNGVVDCETFHRNWGIGVPDGSVPVVRRHHPRTAGRYTLRYPFSVDPVAEAIPGHTPAPLPAVEFNRGDDWFGFPRIAVMEVVPLRGMLLVGMRAERGDVPVYPWNGNRNHIGIPRSWRDGSLSLEEVAGRFAAWMSVNLPNRT